MCAPLSHCRAVSVPEGVKSAEGTSSSTVLPGASVGADTQARQGGDRVQGGTSLAGLGCQAHPLYEGWAEAGQAGSAGNTAKGLLETSAAPEISCCVAHLSQLRKRVGSTVIQPSLSLTGHRAPGAEGNHWGLQGCGRQEGRRARAHLQTMNWSLHETPKRTALGQCHEQVPDSPKPLQKAMPSNISTLAAMPCPQHQVAQAAPQGSSAVPTPLEQPLGPRTPYLPGAHQEDTARAGVGCRGPWPIWL